MNTNENCESWKARVAPFMCWIGELKKPETLRADLIAGITVALVLVPQSMAYAQLAGLPPYYGLYASFLPGIIAAIFGSSRQLATGPVAVTWTLLNRLRFCNCQRNSSYTALQPRSPQELRGWPGGRDWVQTNTCFSGLGITALSIVIRPPSQRSRD